jgi:hypothetical protein
MTQNLIRKQSALINTDKSAYREAKARRREAVRIAEMEAKVEKIESTVGDILELLKGIAEK